MQIHDILKEAGAWDYAQKMTESYCQEARRIIEELNIETTVRRDFEELIDFLEERSF